MGWSLDAATGTAFAALAAGDKGLLTVLVFAGALTLTFFAADGMFLLGFGGAATSSLIGGRTEVHPANQQAATLAGNRAEGRCRGQIQN